MPDILLETVLLLYECTQHGTIMQEERDEDGVRVLSCVKLCELIKANHRCEKLTYCCFSFPIKTLRSPFGAE